MYHPTLGRFLSRDPLSATGVDVLTDTGLYSDRLAAMSADPWFYGGNWEHPYAYAGNNPVRYVDPSGLYASPGYGHFCGPRRGQEWDRITELDCLDLACKEHDKCIGPVGRCVPFTFRLTYCDQMLSIKAYYCAAWGCNTAACRAAALIIGAWMAAPGGGTFPVLPIYK
jgi:hypothetical protein